MSRIMMVMYGRTVGGAEMQFIELANFLALNHSVCLVSLGGDGCIKASKLDKRILVKVYPYKHGRRGAIYPMMIHAWIENIFGKHDVLISTSFYGDCMAFLLSRLGKRKILSLQTVSKCMQNPRVNYFVLRRFDSLIAGASDVRDYLVGQKLEKITVVHNWVDISSRKTQCSSIEIKRKYGLPKSRLIGCVARLHHQKGHVFLIRAFSKVQKSLPAEYILILVGDGPERLALEKEVENLDLRDRVIFLGGVSGSDYNDILGAIDIYVQPSVFEGLPRTILDAMSMGKAIIASDVNGNREAIKDGVNGCLVPPQDADALAKAILNLANDKILCDSLGQQAMKDVMINFEMQTQLKKIEMLVVEAS